MLGTSINEKILQTCNLASLKVFPKIVQRKCGTSNPIDKINKLYLYDINFYMYIKPKGEKMALTELSIQIKQIWTVYFTPNAENKAEPNSVSIR
jgi:hypothetical protein